MEEKQENNLKTPGDNSNTSQKIIQGEFCYNLSKNLLHREEYEKNNHFNIPNDNYYSKNKENNNQYKDSHFKLTDNQNNDILNNYINSQNININNQLDEKKNENSIIFFKKYRKEPRTALENKIHISYLNAVLQSIGHIKKFAFYFLKNKEEIFKNAKKKPLSFVTSRLLIHLYPYPEKFQCETYSTKSYLQVLASLNLIYKTEELKNPIDLLIFILDTLDSENNNKINHQINFKKFDFNDTLEKNLKYFSDNKNVISKNFNWFQLTLSKCSNCNKTMYKLLSFNTFNLDILNSYLINGKKEVSIYDCLNLYELEKTQKLRCDGCDNKFRELRFINKIFYGPDTFIFLIDRGINFNKANILMEIPFKIEENLDLSKYIFYKESKKLKYELSGIVSYLLKEKKFVSYCISPIDDNWYFYNDEIVEYTDLNIILDKHNENKTNVPFILFYRTIPQKK